MENLQQRRHIALENCTMSDTRTDSTSLTVKASLERQNNQHDENRMFLLTGEVTLRKLNNKIGKVFPNLSAEYALTWKGGLSYTV